MVHNKIIFLDVDGVINIPPYLRFDEKCIDNLRKIVKATGAKIVVSSSWRCGNMDLMKEAFDESGFPEDLWAEIIGETVRKWNFTKEGSYLKVVRGNEIGTWVDRHLKYPWHGNPEMDEQYRENNEDGSFKMMKSNKLGIHYSYLILDDDNDMLFCQKDHFVNTDGMVGITDADVEKGIAILNQIDNVSPEEKETKNGVYLRKRHQP